VHYVLASCLHFIILKLYWFNNINPYIFASIGFVLCLFILGSSRVLSFFNHLANDVKKTKTKSLAKKPSLPRSSTLMKPTASQLAKQNQRRQACDSR